MLFVCVSKLLQATLEEVSSERDQLELEKENMSEQLMEKVHGVLCTVIANHS